MRTIALVENGDTKSIMDALRTCQNLAPSIEAALKQLKKEVPAISDMWSDG